MLLYLALASTLISLIFVARTLMAIIRIPVFEELETGDPERLPLLSVIIPACNEAEAIEETVASIQQQDYPELEIILVDDRSDDGSGQIIDRLAAAGERITGLHITELPRGWLGKVHALHTGLSHARGEWVLFTDADVRYGPGLLRKAMAYTLATNLDHFTMIPSLAGGTFCFRIATAAFENIGLERCRARQLSKPQSNAFIGIGAFNLVNRQKLAATPGMEWLRMEVIDDVGLGYMMMLSGARTGVAVCRKALSLTWYHDLPHMARGLEKNMFAVMQFSLGLTLLAAIVMAWSIPAPIYLLFGPYYLLPITLYTLSAILAWAANNRLGRPLTPALPGPIGTLLILWIMVRSAWMCHNRGGVMWRGVHYPLETLKKGRRIRFWGHPKKSQAPM